MTIARVEPDQWDIVGWLWQAFRHDLSPVVNGLPYADGRYQWSVLRQLPSDDAAGHLAWRAHPKTGEAAPVGFSVVTGLLGATRSIAGFWVAPAARRGGVGRTLALATLAAHPGPWSIAFQHDNADAPRFWKAVADEAFGVSNWVEVRRPVPGVPGAPDDHFIETSP